MRCRGGHHFSEEASNFPVSQSLSLTVRQKNCATVRLKDSFHGLHCPFLFVALQLLQCLCLCCKGGCAMRFGVHLVASGKMIEGEKIARVARRAEELGYDSLWVSDHIIFPTELRSAYPYSPDGK